MGQTNDTPAERRTPPTAPRSPARRLPTPPADSTTHGDEQRTRRAASNHARADKDASPSPARPVSRSARPVAPQPDRVGAHGERPPVTPALDATASGDRILVFSTQRDMPRDVSGRDRQLPPQEASDTPDERAAPAALARPRALPVPRERTTENGTGMVSLGDSLRDFVTVLEERRRRRLAEGHDRGEPPVLRTDLDPVCPHCHGAGYLRRDVPVGDPLFGQPLPCECKERELEERRRLEEEAREMARLEQLDRYFSLAPFNDKTFETFDTRWRTGLIEAHEAAAAFAADPWGWLVLAGPPGTGKTHLAAAIAHKLLSEGHSVFFAIVPDLLDHLRAAFAPTSDLTYDEMFECVREVQLLVLDDLGAQNSTSWASEKMFQLLNHRYNLRLLTVITTNEGLFSKLDERIRSRLMDKGIVRRVDIKEKDYRANNIRGARRQR